MEANKNGALQAYVDDVKDKDIHDEKPLGKVVQEETVHSAALAEAVLQRKPSPWSKSMLKLYFIMGKPRKRTRKQQEVSF